MFTIILVSFFLATKIISTNATINCTSGWTPAGSYCYLQASNASVAFDDVFQTCAQLNATIPQFHQISDFDSYVNLTLKPASSTYYKALIGYQRCNFTSITDKSFCSIYDGSQLIVNSQQWETGQPDNYNNIEQCIITGYTMPQLSDMPCSWSSGFTPFCQQGPQDNLNLTEVSCSELCRMRMGAGGYQFVTNYLKCNNNTPPYFVENAHIKKFAITEYIPGLTDAVYEMIPPGGIPAIYAYGGADLNHWLGLSYKISDVFFVINTPNIAKNLLHIVLIRNSNDTPTDSLVTMYNGPEHLGALQNFNWTEVASFYLFNQSNNGMCSLAKDCEWNQWGSWSSCSVTCGNGTQTLTRTKNVTDIKGGYCDNNSTVIQDCVLTPCPIKYFVSDCTWFPWGSWQACSLSCGGGSQTRIRTKEIVQQFGGICDEINSENQACSSDPCPIDCVVSNWMKKSSTCSATCEEGIEEWTRSILTMSQYNGTKCPTDLVESRNCSIKTCKSVYPRVNPFQGFQCIVIVVLTSVTFGIFLFFRVFSVERALHMCQEVCLVMAHLLISYFSWRERSDNIDKNLCLPISIMIQYFYIGYFAFLLLESLQMYCIVTNVLAEGAFVKFRYYMLLGWGFPILVIASAVPFLYNNYISEYSCWINWGHTHASASTFIPVLCLSQVSIIFVEAAGMYNLPKLPWMDKDKYTSALASRFSLVILIPLNVATWITGSMALYGNTMFAHATVTALNVSLGVAIFQFHISANEEVHDFVRHRILFCFYKKKTVK